MRYVEAVAHHNSHMTSINQKGYDEEPSVKCAKHSVKTSSSWHRHSEVRAEEY
jgi:hypothetical protein